MVAGGEQQGAFSDKKIVLRFEHRAHAAQLVRYQEFNAQLLEALQDEHDHQVVLVVFRGDATNQDAIARSK
eukprot:11823970-Alexandrium_andersonii.AAC.1